MQTFQCGVRGAKSGVGFVLRIIFFFLVLGTTGSGFGDEFDILRLKWRDMLTLGTNANPSNPDYAGWIASIGSVAQAHWSSMRTSATRTSLWTDLNGLSTNSADIAATYTRLKAMALGHAVRGSTLQTNTSLRAALFSGLDWMYTNIYNETKTEYDNWFDWEIGSPLALNDSTVLMYEYLSAAQIANYMNAVNHFTPTPDLTGANEVWKASVVAVRGAIVRNGAKIASAKAALSDVFPYVPDVGAGDGFYTEGSFVFHDVFPYNGHYGAELLATIVPLLKFLQGSTWQVTDPAQSNIFRWVYDSFQPFIYRGASMQMVSGRVYTRRPDDHIDGHDLMASILRVTDLAAPADAAAYRGMVKEWVASDFYRDFIQTQPPPFNVMARQIRDDPSIPPRGELVRHYQFPRMDRVVHLRPGWGFGVAMSSSRIGNYESTRGENLRGWYTGEGMTCLYDADLSQFADGFWAAINPYRLPGTTVDTQTRTNGSGEGYLSSNAWTGGAEIDGLYGLSGMQLNAWNSSLSARKSWFMFDDEVVCLGSSITATNNRSVETTIENKRLAGQGNNAFNVNALAKSGNVGWSETVTNPSWAHLGGNAQGSALGYYFPQPIEVKMAREARSGAYADINDTYGSTTPLTRNFLTLWVDHGINPSNAVYAYVLLPNSSAAETASYAAAPDISIIENSTKVQAVKESKLGITAVNFWRDGTNRANGLTVDRKASVICRNDGTYLAVALSDPTQTNTSVVNLEISTNAISVVMSDARITVLQLSPIIRLACDVNGAAGRSLKARFFVGALQTNTITVGADAYVENGANTNSNFGAAQTLALKAQSNPLREAYLRFELPPAPGIISSASLRLTTIKTNDPVLFHALAYVTNNSWTETGITWSNKPVSEAEFTRWQLPPEGMPTAVPITQLAQRAATNDGKLSLRVFATTPPTPTNGFASYASKENGAASKWPQLTLTLGRAPPTVALTSPSDGAVFETGGVINVAASAQDTDSAITEVSFWSGGSMFARAMSPPYAVALSNLFAATYTVTAVARDVTGLMSTSAPVSFSVYNAEPNGSGTGLQGDYFVTQNLAGSGFTRIDPVINFDWGANSPGGSVPSDRFSVRWTGKLQARHTGRHFFHTISDEGVRVWVGGYLLIDNWNRHTIVEDIAPISLIAGQYYDIRVEYYDFNGPAAMQFYWTEPNSGRALVPQSQLYPATGGLLGTYFASTNLTTNPVFTRIDDTINFAWGNGSPDPVLLPGSFSVRWSGKLKAPQSGNYTFHTLSDDGVRLWIGPSLLINNWSVHTAIEDTNSVTLTAGQSYDLIMDYFDAAGVATAVLMWTPPGGVKQVIPKSNLAPSQNNLPPVLTAPASGSTLVLNRGESLFVTAAATDPDLPGQALTFSLDPGAPAGATINPATGALSWSPPDGSPLGLYNITVRVTDSGTPFMTDAATIAVNLIATQIAPVTLVRSNASWHYWDNGTEPVGPGARSWKENGFDDAAWKTGDAILGYGTTAEATAVAYGPNPNNKYITTCFRRALFIPSASLVQTVTARVLRNDGVVIYLNGSEIFRDNMPAGTIANGTLAVRPITGVADTNYTNVTLTGSALAALLVDGTNTIAAELHQNSPSGPDVAFDFQLTGVAAVPSEVPLVPTLRRDTLVLTWPADAALLTLQTTTNLSAPVVWTPVNASPTVAAGQCAISIPVSATRSQFFRLQSD